MSFLAGFKTEVKNGFKGLSGTAMINFTAAGVLLWAYDYYGDTKFFRRHLRSFFDIKGLEADAAGYFYWYGCCFVLLMLVPIVIIAINPHDRLRDYGLGLGDKKIGFIVSGVFVTVMITVLLVIFKWPTFQDYYPLFTRSTSSWELFIYYELAYALYFVAWEFMFRGYMMFGLEKVIGKWAIFVQMVPFAILHFGKPSIEALSSVFGGIALGWLAWRTRSFWYGVFIHATVAVTLDILVGGPRLP